MSATTLHGRILHTLQQLGGAGAASWWRPALPGGACGLRGALWRPRTLVAASLLALAVAAPLTLPYWAAPLRWPALQQMHQQARAIDMHDSRGRWLGVMPSMLQHGRHLQKDIVPEAAPRGFIDVLLALEDRHLDRRTVHGIDLPRMAWLAARWATGKPAGGGSGVSMQLARALHRMRPGGGTPLLWRKLVEVVDGMVLHQRLGGRDGAPFRRWLAAHLPLAMGVPGTALGGEIRGVELAARVLWQRRADELSLAQQALLAAAVRRLILLAPAEDAESLSLRRQRWDYLRRRAALGLKLAYGEDAPEVRHALAELERMPLPQPEAEVLARLAAPRNALRRLRLAANAQLRAASIAASALHEAHATLRARHGADYGSSVHRLRLTLDAAANLRLRRQVQALLPRLARHPRLLADVRRADLLIAVADAQGRVRRLYSSRPGIWRGRYMPGSLAKMVAAVALARRGDAPDALYCRDDAGCNGPTARQAFARSNNSSIRRALGRVPPRELRRLAQHFGLQLHKGAPPATALTLGLAEITPRQALGMTLQLAHLTLHGQAQVITPWLLEMENGLPASLPARQGGADPWSDSATPTLRLSDTQRGYLAAVLQAPLQPGGTMQRVARLAPNVRWVMGKSGTVDTPGGNTRTKWMAAAFTLRGQPYALLVMLSARRNTPLGQSLGDLLAPLAAAAARSMAQE